jgi:hypothetical protein
VCEIAQMARVISQHLVEQVGELSDDSTVSVVYADQGAHGRDLRKVVLGAWGWEVRYEPQIRAGEKQRRYSDPGT